MRDTEFARNLNGYLQNVDYEPLWGSVEDLPSQIQTVLESDPGIMA